MSAGAMRPNPLLRGALEASTVGDTRELIDRSAEMSLAGSLAAERLAQGMLAHSADSYRADR